MHRRRPRKNPPPRPLTLLIIGIAAIVAGVIILAVYEPAGTGVFVIALGVINLGLAEWRRRRPWVPDE